MKRRKKSTAQTWKWKKANPERYTYQTLKDNAKRRGKGFTLTFAQFLNYDAETNYIKERGRTANDQSIDRKDNEDGYNFYNIHPLTVSQNSIKGTTLLPDDNPVPF